MTAGFGPRDPHGDRATLNAAWRIQGCRHCSTCGGRVFRNGRKELIHTDYMEHAHDHHAQIETIGIQHLTNTL